MNSKRKLTVGFWLTVITMLIADAAVIVYHINISSEGYYQGAAVPKTSTFCTAALVLLILGLVFAFLTGDSAIGKLFGILNDLCRMAAPATLAAAAMYLISARAEGFAFIYFSNAEVLQEVQTAANISSAHLAIANLILLAAGAFIGIIAAFFTAKKRA